MHQAVIKNIFRCGAWTVSKKKGFVAEVWEKTGYPPEAHGDEKCLRKRVMPDSKAGQVKEKNRGRSGQTVNSEQMPASALQPTGKPPKCHDS